MLRRYSVRNVLFLCIPLLVSFHPTIDVEQIPDILILQRDTIALKSFPLEELKFSTRPFQYGYFPFPNRHCIRGYQATWKVIDKKLMLTEVRKVDDSGEKLDLVPYFIANDYDPIVINGNVFADWYTMEFKRYPGKCFYRSCFFPKRKVKNYPTELRIEAGILTMSKL